MCDQKNAGDRGEMSDHDDEPEEQPSSAAFDPELDHDDDDDDDNGGEVDVSAPVAGHKVQSSFTLRGGGSVFSNRSHSIFECLDSVARLASPSLNQDNVTRVFAQHLPPRPSRKTSQPLSSCPTRAKQRGVPDYLVHPERWTHYSLEDVTETSDQGNSRVAHHFLSSLQQRKQQQQQESRIKSDSSCNIQQKMIFSRPSSLLKEYPANQLSSGRGKEKETHLSHLEDENEEGREKEMAGGKRTDHSVEKAKERVRDEEKDTRGAFGQSEEMKQVQREKEEEAKVEEKNITFTSFRNTKRKNYRKSSGREDN